MLISASAVDGLLRYGRIHAEASDGMQHLKNIQAMVPAKGDYTALLTAESLNKVQGELTAAQRDFSQLRMDLNSPGGTLAVGAHMPVVGSTISSAAALAAAADEACRAGLDLTRAGQTMLAVLKSGIFMQSGTKDPPGSITLNTQTIAGLAASFDDAVQHLDAGMNYIQSADLSTLPSSLVKPKQLAQLRDIIANWPSTRQQIRQVKDWLGVAPTILGARAPEHLLLVMMDRSELRATGGFMGNYAVATVQNGRMQPFSLNDTILLDGPYIAQSSVPLVPPPAYSWWPFGAFALRDANLSGDFPTSAQLSLHELQLEGGEAQGMIAFTPVAIERVLTVIGNVPVPEYNEVATPTNLEALIHKYQQLLAKGESEGTRKAFTALLAQHLMSKLHGLPAGTLVKVGQAMQTSIRTKDIQIYFADKAAEKVLSTTGFDGSIAHGPGDGVIAVDDNVGANKANQFITVHYADSVSLDAHGTATHTLTVTYTMNGHGDPLLFGLGRYLTYVRIYAPPDAKLSHLDGLNFTNYGPNQINHSDFPNRQMWGGYVNVADGTSYSLHLTWSVAHAATLDGSGRWSYQLDFQHQAGSTQSLSLTVTVPGITKPVLTFNGPLTEDKHVSVQFGGNG